VQQPKPPPPAAAEKRWQKTQYTNLIRYAPSGTYFARLRVGGKLIRQSLKTDVLSVAKLRLGDLEKAERCAAESRDGVSAGRMLSGGPAAIYGQRIDGEPALKAKSKAYYHQRIAALFRSWPSLENTDVRRINKNECLMWAAKFGQGQEASPTAFNNTVIASAGCPLLPYPSVERSQLALPARSRARPPALGLAPCPWVLSG